MFSLHVRDIIIPAEISEIRCGQEEKEEENFGQGWA